MVEVDRDDPEYDPILEMIMKKSDEKKIFTDMELARKALDELIILREQEGWPAFELFFATFLTSAYYTFAHSENKEIARAKLERAVELGRKEPLENQTTRPITSDPSQETSEPGQSDSPGIDEMSDKITELISNFHDEIEAASLVPVLEIDIIYKIFFGTAVLNITYCLGSTDEASKIQNDLIDLAEKLYEEELSNQDSGEQPAN
jgi:hypothetical protein